MLETMNELPLNLTWIFDCLRCIYFVMALNHKIVKSILTAIDDETKNWVEGWIKELVIPPRSLQKQ